MKQVEQTTVSIQCTDGFTLSGTIFAPTQAKGGVLIGPATGIKQQFYFNFCSFLANHGYAVLAFDNRAIGASKGEDINGVNASLVNWGRLDLTAALKHLQVSYPGIPYHLIGHSAGGQLVGLMDNAQDLTSMFNFGCSSGSIHNARYPFKLQSYFFLNIYIPLSNLLFGHTKSQWIGMGEPLPKKVASEWSRWCNGKGYVQVDLGTKITEHQYDALDFPSRWLHATDDEIANYDNVKDMIRVYPNITSSILSLDPKTYGYQDIGHMKFFSSRRKALWQLALEWLDDF